LGSVAGGDPFEKWKLDATAKFAPILQDEQARAYLLGRESRPQTIRDWKWIVDVLPNIVAEAMRSTNPNFGGFNPRGPFARFAEALIPHICGEHPAGSSVVRRLQERKNS
jgi:hypothetical protein